MTYSIEKVATLIGARRYGEQETTIGWLLTDSRSLCFPEQTLFFALRSKRNDGHKFIDELYRRGVRSFVVEQEPADYQTAYPDANFLKVPSPLAALQRLAERHRDEFDIPVVGITGSNGKTWVKEWLYQILMPTMKVIRSPKSYNSQIGVPLSVWLMNEQTQVALLEAGISEPGEMLALHDIIQPTIGVLTSLGSAHQENFRNMDEKCMEKLQLFRDTEAKGYALLDQPWHVNFVAVAANNIRRYMHGQTMIPEKFIPSTLNLIRTILRIAYNNGQRRLVLGAFGCGAFANPPGHMAQLFKQIFNEPEFKGIFREIYFAIIEDHNSKGQNYNAFNEIFSHQ